ncbi:hypothetical protein KFK09_017679 [Dendrobium nobile]|uniref:RNase H type-1 domain-containing protein n=1 Tax=Dendrobium nobile TaxID=94219 RepID=A0A8T3AZ53_DENNO|nr:hypothetical protein KFK09_017679 [Dendrobium nobile]
MATCGGGLRDSNGNCILSFAGPCYNCDVNTATIFVILYGLSLCFSLDCINIMGEVGSSYYYESIIMKNDKKCSPKHFYMRVEIKNWLNMFNFSFSIINMEGNACANAMARWGCGVDSMANFISYNLPLHVRRLLNLDKINVPYVIPLGALFVWLKFKFLLFFFISLSWLGPLLMNCAVFGPSLVLLYIFIPRYIAFYDFVMSLWLWLVKICGLFPFGFYDFYHLYF